MYIVIVGAGPIGMYFVVYFLFKYPNLDVYFTLVEKRKSYTRKQIVTISSNYLPISDKETNIEIKDFEIMLRNYLHTLNNVEFINGECVDLSETTNEILVRLNGSEYILEYDYLIGCDGSKSIIRELIEKQKTKFFDKPFYSLIVFLNHYIVNNKYSKNCIYLQTDKSSSISVNIDKKDYVDDYEKNPENERDVYARYILGKYCSVNVESDIADTCMFKSEPYYVLKPYKNNVYLLGDSMLTTHYFTGLGIENGFYFTNILVDNFFNEPGKYIDYYLDRKIIEIQNEIYESLTKSRFF